MASNASLSQASKVPAAQGPSHGSIRGSAHSLGSKRSRSGKSSSKSSRSGSHAHSHSQRSAASHHPPGTTYFTIVKLRNLKNRAFYEQHGALYIQMEVQGKGTYKTRECKRTGEPVWDQTFAFVMGPWEVIKWSLIDVDWYIFRNEVGSATLSVQGTKSSQKFWVNLIDPDTDRPVCELLVMTGFEVKPNAVADTEVTETIDSQASIRPYIAYPQRGPSVAPAAPTQNQTLHVVKAKDLPSGDPYVVVSVGSDRQQTGVGRKRDGEVEWSEDLTFAVAEGDFDMVKIQVMDKDRFSEDDAMCCGLVTLKDIRRTDTGKWVSLKSPRGSAAGQLLITRIPEPFTTDRRSSRSSSSSSTSRSTSRRSTSTVPGAAAAGKGKARGQELSVTVVRAEGLRAGADPYVTLTVNGFDQKHSTSKQRNSPSPVWRETFALRMAPDDHLHVALMEDDVFSRDDVLGTAQVPASVLMTQRHVVCQMLNKAESAGTVVLETGSDAAGHGSTARSASVASSPFGGDSPQRSGSVAPERHRVTVVSAYSLGTDRSERRYDGFVTLGVNQKDPLFGTRVIRDSATPVWQEDFVVEVAPGDTLWLTLKEEMGAADTVLGRGSVVVRDLEAKREMNVTLSHDGQDVACVFIKLQ